MMLFFGFVFNTVVLCFLIWLVARKTAQFDFATVFNHSLVRKSVHPPSLSSCRRADSREGCTS